MTDLYKLDAVRSNGLRLRHLSKEDRSDKAVVFAACSNNGQAIQFASSELQLDSDVVRAALKHGLTLRDLTKSQRNCKDEIFVAIEFDWRALACASDRLRGDRDVIFEACKKDWRAYELASSRTKRDPDFALAICIEHGAALQHASEEIRSNKEIVMAICRKHGLALQHASDLLRADKEVVLTAVKSDTEALKFALQGLNQDPDCLVAAKLWDEDYEVDGQITPANTTKIVLSTRFSLNARSSSTATQFTKELKRHPYIRDGEFLVYSPNAFSKGTCDPEWTRLEWTCRGTYESCRTEDLSLKTGVPQPGCCWRYSFRWQLEEARRTNGFMIQLVDFDKHGGDHVLGKGQQIETEMARDVGTKVFRVHQPAWNENTRSFMQSDIEQLIATVKEWYENDFERKSKCDIRITYFQKN